MGAETASCGTHCKGKSKEYACHNWISLKQTKIKKLYQNLYLTDTLHLGGIIYCQLSLMNHKQASLIRVELYTGVTSRWLSCRNLNSNWFSLLPCIDAPDAKLQKVVITEIGMSCKSNFTHEWSHGLQI